MKMRQFLIDTLKGLESAVPPPQHCHHAITYVKYGSGEDGLALQLNHGGKFYSFFINEDDAEDSPSRIIDYVVATLSDGKLQAH
jgi:hypothetical protein